jgi:hypothetical protein
MISSAKMIFSICGRMREVGCSGEGEVSLAVPGAVIEFGVLKKWEVHRPFPRFIVVVRFSL